MCHNIIYKMVKIIAEIGINHNGDIEQCKKMIMLSKVAGADYVKIQKRNPDVCVPEHQKSKMRNTPWGMMTYLEYKHRLEFNEIQIKELIDYSNELGIDFFASVWDLDSVYLPSCFIMIPFDSNASQISSYVKSFSAQNGEKSSVFSRLESQRSP